MQSHAMRRGRPRRHVIRWILTAALLAAVLYGGLLYRTRSLLMAAQFAVLEHQMAEAQERVQDAGFYRVQKGQVLEAKGLLELLAGRLDTARDLLGHARQAGTTRPGLDPDVIAARLAETARYPAVDLLVEHRRKAGGPQVAAVWQAEARLGQDDLAAAAALLEAGLADSNPLAPRYRRLQKLLKQRQATKRSDIIFDRGGRPVYGLNLPGGTPFLKVPDLAPALTGEGGALQFLSVTDLSGQVHLTIDLAYQKAAHAALGRYTGAFVALQPQTGAILALVSHAGPDEDGPPAYRQQFEPGSIVKMVTLAGALDSQLEMDRMFPLNCTGNMTLDGKVFYDWVRHGTVASPQEATAVSCNLAFASMGLEMGQARLDDTLARFGFGLSLSGSDLAVDMGQLQSVNPAAPRFGLASRSVGLRNITITPLHAALLGAALAHQGQMMRPYIVASRTALGSTEPYATAAPQLLLQATQPATADIIGEAMEQVVTAAHGTGRRAAVEGLKFAMKTGTAGERRGGFNSIVFGFAPLEHPQVAFGFVAEHAGKAELEGARILRDFLTTVRNEFGQTH